MPLDEKAFNTGINYTYLHSSSSGKRAELAFERAFTDASEFMDPAGHQPMANHDIDQQQAGFPLDAW